MRRVGMCFCRVLFIAYSNSGIAKNMKNPSASYSRQCVAQNEQNEQAVLPHFYSSPVSRGEFSFRFQNSGFLLSQIPIFLIIPQEPQKTHPKDLLFDFY